MELTVWQESSVSNPSSNPTPNQIYTGTRRIHLTATTTCDVHTWLKRSIFTLGQSILLSGTASIYNMDQVISCVPRIEEYLPLQRNNYLAAGITNTFPNVDLYLNVTVNLGEEVSFSDN